MNFSFMQNEVVRATCWTLVHSLWQGLLLAIVAGLVLIGTRKSNASKRYRLLVAVFMCFVLVTTLTFAKMLRTEWQNSAAVSLVSSVNPVDAVVLTTIADGGTTTEASPSFLEKCKTYFDTHASLIVMIWFVIFMARFVQLIANLAYVQRLKHYKTSTPSEAWQQKVDELVTRLGIRKKIALIESGIVQVPVVMGVLRPIILLPFGLIAHLPADEIEAILLHELAHIRRRDYLVNLVQNFVEAIYFFNPALIWLSSVIREERENCCDDIAISITNNKSKFINALIAFQEYNFSHAKYNVGFAGKKNQLLNRVKRIIHEKNKTLNATEKSILSFAMGIFILLSFAAAQKIKSTGPLDNAVKELQRSEADRQDIFNEHRQTDANTVPSNTATMNDLVQSKRMDTIPDRVLHFDATTGSKDTVNGYAHYGEIVRYSDLIKSVDALRLNDGKPKTKKTEIDDARFDMTFSNKDGTITGKGYATYGEVVTYKDLMNTGDAGHFIDLKSDRKDTVPGKEKRVEERSSGRTVYGGTEYRKELAAKIKADTSFNAYTGLSVNIKDQKRTVTATKRDGTIYMYNTTGASFEGLTVNGVAFKGSAEESRTILREIESAIESRRQMVEDRKMAAMADIQKKTADKQRHIAEANLRHENENALKANQKAMFEDRKALLRDTLFYGADKKRLFKDSLVWEKTAKGGFQKARAADDVQKDDIHISAKGGYVEARSGNITLKAKEMSIRRSMDSAKQAAVEERTRAGILSKEDHLKIEREKSNAVMDVFAEKMRGIIADLESNGISIDKKTGWFALDKGQFIVDGKTMSPALHEKFLSRYVTSNQNWGYYYGPVKVTGKGIFMDYSDLSK